MTDIEEYPFSCINTPSSLLYLTSAQVALELWRHKYEEELTPVLGRELNKIANTFACDHLVEWFLRREWSCDKILDVPSLLKAQINQTIVSIGKELEDGVRLHWLRCFFDGGVPLSRCIKHIVTNCYGTICFKTTAMNMLNSNEFSNVEKYRISCEYCFEDHVKRFWRLIRENERIPDPNSIVATDYLNSMVYWNARVTRRRRSDKRASRIKQRLFNSFMAHNWTAFEYFWQMLSVEEKFSRTIEYIERGRNETVVRLLPRLNRADAEDIFRDKAEHIFLILAPNERYCEHVYQLWADIGHVVLDNRSKFVQVLLVLWRLVFSPEDDLGLNHRQCDQINRLMLEIWSTARDELKAYVLNNHAEEFIIRLHDRSIGFSSYYGHNMKMALEILEKSRQIVYKQHLWDKHWKKFALRAKPAVWQQLMRMCLPDDEAAVEYYRRKLLNFRRLFALLIESGFYTDLRDYLEFFSNDAESFQLSSRQILRSNTQLIMQHDDEKLDAFERFVGEIFPNVEEQMNFKARIISSPKGLKCLLDVNRERSFDFGSVISGFLTSPNELRALKKKLLQRCGRYLSDGKSKEFYTEQWRQLIEWCTDADANKIAKFKQSLQLDVIFKRRLELHYGLGVSYDTLFENKRVQFIKRFLKWYYEDEEDAKNLKLNKINNYANIDVFGNALNSCELHANHALLLWFYANDEEKVNEFYVNCGFTPLEFYYIDGRRRV